MDKLEMSMKLLEWFVDENTDAIVDSNAQDMIAEAQIILAAANKKINDFYW